MVCTVDMPVLSMNNKEVIGTRALCFEAGGAKPHSGYSHGSFLYSIKHPRRDVNGAGEATDREDV